MNSIKLRIIFIIIAAIYIGLVPAVFAMGLEESISDKLGGFLKEINGVEIKEMRIFICEGEEMIQLRELADEYNWSLYYDSVKKEIILRNRNQTVILKTVSEKDKGVEGLYPFVSAGRTYLSIPMLKRILEDLGEERVITGLYTDKDKFGVNETISAHLRLYNFTEETIKLDFGSGQRYDLYLRKNKQEVWRWSEGRFFTMALVREELEAGEILGYDVDIDLELETGNYILSGELAIIPGRMALGEIQIEITED